MRFHGCTLIYKRLIWFFGFDPFPYISDKPELHLISVLFTLLLFSISLNVGVWIGLRRRLGLVAAQLSLFIFFIIFSILYVGATHALFMDKKCPNKDGSKSEAACTVPLPFPLLRPDFYYDNVPGGPGYLTLDSGQLEAEVMSPANLAATLVSIFTHILLFALVIATFTAFIVSNVAALIRKLFMMLRGIINP
jgi:hypothetical protein